MITRIHLKPREALFTVMKVARGPKDAKAVGSIRLTIGQFDDGEICLVLKQFEDFKGPTPKAARGVDWKHDISDANP